MRSKSVLLVTVIACYFSKCLGQGVCENEVYSKSIDLFQDFVDQMHTGWNHPVQWELRYVDTWPGLDGNGVWFVNQDTGTSGEYFQLIAFFMVYQQPTYRYYFELKYYSTTDASLENIIINGEAVAEYTLPKSEDLEWSFVSFQAQEPFYFWPQITVQIVADNNTFFLMELLTTQICDGQISSTQLTSTITTTIQTTEPITITPDPTTSQTTEPITTQDPTTSQTTEPITTPDPTTSQTTEPITITPDPTTSQTTEPITTQDPTTSQTTEPITTPDPTTSQTTEPITTQDPTTSQTTEPITITPDPITTQTTEPITTSPTAITFETTYETTTTSLPQTSTTLQTTQSTSFSAETQTTQTTTEISTNTPTTTTVDETASPTNLTTSDDNPLTTPSTECTSSMCHENKIRGIDYLAIALACMDAVLLLSLLFIIAMYFYVNRKNRRYQDSLSPSLVSQYQNRNTNIQ